MPARDPVLTVTREWIQKAENDLITAAHSLKLGKNCPTDTVAFHAQQCVEKYLKAILVYHRIDFPKVHDIEKLVRILPSHMLEDWPLREQRSLTIYATITRYPGSYEAIELAEARQAVRIARRIRREIRNLMPKSATRRIKK